MVNAKGTIIDYPRLSAGRKAYWDDKTGTVVIVVITNPKDPDGGTAFRPVRGKDYFKDLQ